MRATKLTAGVAVATIAAAPLVIGQAGAHASSNQDDAVSAPIVTQRSDNVRELEIIRGKKHRLQPFVIGPGKVRELEIIRGTGHRGDELEITPHRP